MIICFKTAAYRRISIHPLGEAAYPFDCTLFRLIGLTAKALRRITMNGFLVGANEPKKRTLKRVQLRILGSRKTQLLEKGACLADILRSSNRLTLPVLVMGSWSINSTTRGYS